MQKNCNRRKFGADLRKAYVRAVVEASVELQRDCNNWCHLLSEKGSQMSSQTLREDFVNSYKFECVCADGLTEDAWAALIYKRRSELGIRVNSFHRDVEKFMDQIPDTGEIDLLSKALSMSKSILKDCKDAERDDSSHDPGRDKDDVSVTPSKRKPFPVRFIHS